MIIATGSDHAGYATKEKIIKELESNGHKILDFGTYSEESVDYPDFAHKVAAAVESGEAEVGILMCGSGNGINMTANKHRGIRSALCWNEKIARLARRHNDANVLALPARFIDEEKAKKIANAFLAAGFEGGRHEHRVKKIGIL